MISCLLTGIETVEGGIEAVFYNVDILYGLLLHF